MDACLTGAIPKRTENGIVLVDRDLCNVCGACADACPYGVPQFGQDGIMQKCNLWVERLAEGKEPACIGTCPSEELKFGPLEELAELPSARRLDGSLQPSMLISSEKDLFWNRFCPGNRITFSLMKQEIFETVKHAFLSVIARARSARSNLQDALPRLLSFGFAQDRRRPSTSLAALRAARNDTG